MSDEEMESERSSAGSESESSDEESIEDKRKKNIARNEQMMAAFGVAEAKAGVGGAKKSKQRKPRVPKEKVDHSPQRMSARQRGISAPNVFPVEPKPLPRVREPRLAHRAAAQGRRDTTTPEKFELATVLHLNALGTCAVRYPKGRKDATQASDKEHSDDKQKTIVFTTTNGNSPICHWCRHRDPPHKAACTECDTRFCGSCLQNRYGENLWECQPGWKCPICRGTCNCSGSGCLRKKRNLSPTGSMTKSAAERGFESAAHLLILGHFDDMVLALAAAVASPEPNDAKLHKLLQLCEEMELETPVQVKPFVHSRLPDEVRSTPTEVLFENGCTPEAVVSRLSALRDSARAAQACLEAPIAKENDQVLGNLKRCGDVAGAEVATKRLALDAVLGEDELGAPSF